MKTRLSPLSLAAPVPRNPFVLAARARRAGPHRPSAGARRQHGQRELQQLLRRDAPPHRHSP
jgi:hypothetical protein